MTYRRRKIKKGVIAAAAVICLAVVIVCVTVSQANLKKAVGSSSSSQLSSSSSYSSPKSSSSLEVKPQNSSSSSSSVHSASSTSSVSQQGWGNAEKLILVNKAHLVPADYSPSLTTVPIKYYYSKDKDSRFDPDAAPALEQMINDGKKAGFNLVILSGYRTYQYQQNNFNRQVNKLITAGETSSQAKINAATLVAPAGASEHETGLAADIITGSWYSSNGYELTSSFENTSAFKWLYSHCTEYGFILRYGKDKTGITKYQYEPWHYRYVGKKAAKSIMSSNLCLEEYLNQE